MLRSKSKAGKAVPQHTYGCVLIHDLVTRWGEWSASRHDRAFPPGKGPLSSHWTGGWVGPRAGMDTEVRRKILSPLPRIEPRSIGRPVRSQTLLTELPRLPC
jgi:hypothetical protein